MKKQCDFETIEKDGRLLTPLETALKNIHVARLKFGLMVEIQSLVEVLTDPASSEDERDTASIALEAIADANEYYDNISA